MLYRFVNAEKWRKDTKLDELLPTWEYPEKEAIFKYYPQYYHKTDKVRSPPPRWQCLATSQPASPVTPCKAQGSGTTGSDKR